MPNEGRNQHSRQTPHYDGKNEAVINDNTGTQMGIKLEMNEEFTRKKQAFPADLQPDQNMKAFSNLMDGKSPKE